MSTREDKKSSHDGAIDLGLEGNSFPENFSIPSCTIEDVDRSLFSLLKDQLPFQYESEGTQKRVPVIFATGERFAVLRRKEPLRDESNALILPLISVMRTGISQDTTPAMGFGQNLPITIRRKIDKSTGVFKRYVNEEGFENSPNMTTPVNQDLPGRVAKRLNNPPPPNPSDVKGMPTTSTRQNVYETIVMPPVKFFTANYDVTFWCQYTTQMNNMMSALISMYQDNHKRTFKLETDKGYWFVAYVGGDLSPQENFDDFSDDERLVKYSFTVSVNAYQIVPDYPGAPIFLRRKVSSPEITFEVQDNVPSPVPMTHLSSDPSALMFEDIATVDDPYPGQSVAGSSTASSRAVVGDVTHGASFSQTAPGGSPSEGGTAPVVSKEVPAGEVQEVGGTKTDNLTDIVEQHEIHPVTGEIVNTFTVRVGRNSRAGETVHRVINPSILGKIT